MIVVVVVVMLMLGMLVVDDLGWFETLLEIQPETRRVDDQTEDSDHEELHLEVRREQLQQQTDLRLEQHTDHQQFL